MYAARHLGILGMGWLTDIFRGKRINIVRLEGDGDFECEVVGESHYQDALDRIVGGKTREGHEHECEAVLVRDLSNRNDPNAVAVQINGMTVGYLSRPHARAMASIFEKHRLAEARARALIVGGWSDRGGRKAEGHYGVKLDIPV